MFDQRLLNEAMHVRHVVLGMLFDGVVSSEIDVSRATMASSAPLTLAKLLEYSESTRKHAALLRLIWAPLPNSPVVSEDYTNARNIATEADLFYQPAENGKIHNFQLSGKYVIPQTVGRNVALLAVIFQNNLRFQGLWGSEYTYIDRDQIGMVETSDLAGTNVYPERQMLLHYYMSPERLSGEEVGRLIPGSSDLLSVIRYERVYTYKGFRHFQFNFDGPALGREYLKDGNRSLVRQANFLLTRGNLRFCVVEIGTTVIDGIPHWIYTGSERIEGQPK